MSVHKSVYARTMLVLGAHLRAILQFLKLTASMNLFPFFCKVYKLFGPVLVKQDLEESRQNVGKRMDYIKKELKRVNERIEDLEKKQDKHRETIQKLQQKLQMTMALK